MDKGVFVVRYSTKTPSQPCVAAPLSAAQSEIANAPSTVACSTGSKSARAGVEVEEKVGKDSQLETAKAADVVTHAQPTRRSGPADYVTVEWKDAEEDRGVGTD